jgi:nitroreductase
MDAIDMLLTRTSNGKLGEPAPDERSLQLALDAAVRAPDHGLLRPWRLLLVRGAAREQLGLVLREALRRRTPDASPAELAREQNKPLRAPLLIVVSARVREHAKVPAIEQVLSAAAAAQNILLALHATGYTGMWRTGPAAYDSYVRQALGLEASDVIVGFIYAGTPTTSAPAIARPTSREHAEEWTGSDRPDERHREI